MKTLTMPYITHMQSLIHTDLFLATCMLLKQLVCHCIYKFYLYNIMSIVTMTFEVSPSDANLHEKLMGSISRFMIKLL